MERTERYLSSDVFSLSHTFFFLLNSILLSSRCQNVTNLSIELYRANKSKNGKHIDCSHIQIDGIVSFIKMLKME